VSRQSTKKDAIGFPPPLLGEAPLRLPVLAESADWLALDKPAGVGLRAHPWDSEPDLDAALNRQLEAGKPELRRRGASLFGSIYYLDPPIAGVALLAKNRAALTDLKNRFGSGQCRFEFIFVAASDAADGPEQLTADAPLLPHNVKPKMIPSTAKGKKASTRFQRLARAPSGWALWRAEVGFFRPHQVRCHAALAAIPALGDALYGGPPPPTRAALAPRKKGPRPDLPAFEGLALRLSAIRFPGADAGGADASAGPSSDGGAVAIAAPPDRHFRLLLRRMALTPQD
jgi:23S rRNA-/tRNA-specific pseudouridylate synthase